ncbi:cytochrome c oxidase accessory protein CcoG [Ferrimonas balearica]|uniref:cytochrome c oxidase accessory protein CcoG n=1 Tax=Ferrimonas balearica TaxID=44012 RepID=UPI001C99DE67|nr:cytochrome c oxidase accessory protein CcoG [Ferrimonas balearica]MBY5923447.1 cytochrome c oxidase accessory protein CcoG [Ferrimonas balearica]MBY5997826.1 cytochrome c oxidase accessory protein CcoG [Ferrimonas balearica]
MDQQSKKSLGREGQPITVQPARQGAATRGNPRNRIYVRKTDGVWSQLRRRMGWVMMGLFLLLPWLPWGDRQAVLFDLAQRKFYVFGLTIWPQDLILLALLFMIAAFALFFFTTFLGRVWCGYMCPQSVWTFIYIWFEEKIEGPRNKRMKLDQAPWDWNKLWRKTAKHSAWILIALVTALTFLSYFYPSRELYLDFFTGQAPGVIYFWALFFTFCTYGNAGWMREIMCLHMCPYARFQSAMFDSDTFIVGYDTKRGETRGPRGRKQDPKAMGLGDCIDCSLCVQVCPTGIDIRNGLQYECINCGACIDTCDDVMAKMGYDKGLISYTTERQLAGGESKVARPKLLGYGVVLGVMVLGFIYTLLTLAPVQIDVLRDRNQLYRETRDGLVENVYTLRLLNKTDQDQQFNLSVTGLPEYRWSGDQTVRVAAGEVYTLPISVAVDPFHLKKPMTEIIFELNSVDGQLQSQTESRFISSM